MEITKTATVRKIIYAVILVLASLPLACGYVMEGGDILLWLARIEEVKEQILVGNIQFFPTRELTLEQNGQFWALNSNLWLIIPSALRCLGLSVTAVYRIYMLVLNLIALITAVMMFQELFDNEWVTLLGSLLYMTCPYRIYIFYDKANLGMAAAWTLIPLVLWGILKICRKSGTWKSTLVTAAAFAAVGYSDGILLLILTGVVVLAIIWYRKPAGLLPVMAGSILYLPGALYWIKYLLTEQMASWCLPLSSIAHRGYAFGHFFSSWAYREDCPGLGLALIAALLLLLWLALIDKDIRVTKKYGLFITILCLLAVMSMNSFIWDYAQRIGAPILKLVSLIETPGVCFGFVSLAASVLGAYGIECAAKQQKLFIKVGIPLIVAFSALGVCVYLCNTLTYYRVPMFL